MSTYVDLGPSKQWLAPNCTLPQWLTKQWLEVNDACLVCQLENPDDLYALRAIVPDTSRLLAYPGYPLQAKLLDSSELQKLQSLFVAATGAEKYLALSPGTAGNAMPLPSPIPLAEESENDASQLASLALVSPMPPTPSGVGNYCAELLPSLARHYKITLVVEEPELLADEIKRKYETVSHAQFMAIGDAFDRVMYHVGNSAFHYDYFTMLKTHPGTVVLHSTYLGNSIFSNFRQMADTELRQFMYSSHGWPALLDCETSLRQAIELYPACGGIFRDAYGVTVHSAFAAEALSLHFDEHTRCNLSISGLGITIKDLPPRSIARTELGTSEDETIFASFGELNTDMCLKELMAAWKISGLAENTLVKLYLVGDCSDADLDRELIAWRESLPHPSQVVITGFVDTTKYDLYLAATNVAVQLRRNSRGESSTAVLDCMAAGLPTISNAHGSVAELSKAHVMMLEEPFGVEELAGAFSHAAENLAEMTSMGAAARKYVAETHSLGAAASLCSEHMESNYRSMTKVKANELRRELFLPRLDNLPPDKLWEYVEQYDDLATCFGAIGASLSGAQLLVDISAIVIHDLKSGIQRVVRNILRELLQNRDIPYRVEAIYFDFQENRFRYARKFTESFLGIAPTGLADDVVEAGPGDIFLGLDLFYLVVCQKPSRKWLQYWRGRGVKMVWVLYDILPVHFPHCFPPDQIPLFRNWLESISDLSDGVACISKSVADEYDAWRTQNPSEFNAPNIGYFHLGADLEEQDSALPLTEDEKKILESLSSSPFLLMVGTIEPRKGHNQVLDALDILWSKGEQTELVIVGSTGWATDGVIEKLESMNAEKEKLHWLEFVSEALLRALYKDSAGTMMASIGEGFGLPLIEAAYFGSPIIARDLPVFREVSGDSAWYFQAENSAELADQLGEWIHMFNQGIQPSSSGLQWNSWEQSTSQLLESVVYDNWYLDQ